MFFRYALCEESTYSSTGSRMRLSTISDNSLRNELSKLMGFRLLSGPLSLPIFCMTIRFPSPIPRLFSLASANPLFSIPANTLCSTSGPYRSSSAGSSSGPAARPYIYIYIYIYIMYYLSN